MNNFQFALFRLLNWYRTWCLIKWLRLNYWLWHFPLWLGTSISWLLLNWLAFGRSILIKIAFVVVCTRLWISSHITNIIIPNIRVLNKIKDPKQILIDLSVQCSKRQISLLITDSNNHYYFAFHSLLQL